MPPADVRQPGPQGQGILDHIGLEDVDDLWQDLARALDICRNV